MTDKDTKMLTAAEMVKIIVSADDEIDCADAYRHFLEGLGALIADHFGGERGMVHEPLVDTSVDTADDAWMCGFHHNDCVPPDGGVYKKYDTDVSWEE